MKEQLTIVIPCYNEGKNIPVVFPPLLKYARENQYKIIAVNDGSNDDTAEKLSCFAGEECLTVLHHKCNRGYGAAIKKGLENVQTDFAVTLDADGQHRIEDVKKLFDCLREHDADLVIGARENNASGIYRSFGKFLIRCFAKMALNLSVKDLNSGMKCYRLNETREFLELCPDTMSFSDVIALLMIDDRKKVLEVPIQVVPRTTGKSTINAKTALVTVTEILNLAVLLHPLTTFFRLGMIFLLAGIAWAFRTYFYSRSVSSAASTCIICGSFCFILGLLGEQLSKIRRQLLKNNFK